MSSAAGRSTTVSIGEKQDARVDVVHDRDYKARVNIRGPNDQKWVFGIISGTEAEFVSAHDDGRLSADTAPPEWVYDVLRYVGLDVDR